MEKIKLFFSKLSKKQKSTILIVVVAFVLLISLGIPTLARIKNRTSMYEINVWDGSIATSYRSGDGSLNNPYIISNASELAFLAEQLLITDYNDKHFKLNNDIVINDGIFEYDGYNIKYIKEGATYYVKPYTTDYYETTDFTGEKKGSINSFKTLNNFKGNIEGDSFKIYGLYITDENAKELALFTNFTGNIINLYVENSLVYGGNITGGLASTVYNSTLENVLYDGYIIGKNSDYNEELTFDISDKKITLTEEVTQEVITMEDIKLNQHDITGITFEGEIVIENSTLENTTILINGNKLTDSVISIDLGTNLSDITFEMTSLDENVVVDLTNLKFKVNYNYSYAGMIAASIDNTSLKNVISRGYVFGNKYAGGISGVIKDTNIINSYNNASVESNNNAAGLVANIINSESETKFTNCYNSGLVQSTNAAGLINLISNNNAISISNTFNTASTDYNIRTIENTVVVVDNSFTVSGSSLETGTLSGSFLPAALENLQDKQTMIDVVFYKEFVDIDNLKTDENAVWVYEDNSLPILYIDEINNPIANIHAGTYSWNNLGYELNSLLFNSNITFSVREIDSLKPIKEAYYYVHKSSSALNKDEIEAIMMPLEETETGEEPTWVKYEDVVEISNEGFYIIYAKVVDYNDKVTYLNSDLLVLDLSGALIDIKFNGMSWNTEKENLDYVYVSNASSVTIEADDLLSGVANVQYYISNEKLTKEQVSQIALESWTLYQAPIAINSSDKKIIYVKVTDNCNFVSYANTDYISLNGYQQGNLTLGRNEETTLNNLFITDKSIVSLKFTYSDSVGYSVGDKHNLISNTLLPKGTKITLLDNVTKTVYTYKIETSDDIYNYTNSCDASNNECIKKATYPLSLFKNGKVSVDEYFDDSKFTNKEVNEDFKIILDFMDAEITDNLNNLSLHMNVVDENGKVIRSTLDTTVKQFNVYKTIDGNITDASIYLTAVSDANEIIYNSDSETNITFSTGVNYKYINGNKIYDTTMENKNIGLYVKFVDENNQIIDKKYLKNILLKIGANEYAAYNDGVFRIDLKTGLTDTTQVLTVLTNEDNIKLPLGNYKIQISNYLSYDGLYTKDIEDNLVEIPVVVSNSSTTINYSFDIVSTEDYKIINRNTSTVLNFSILQNGALVNPKVVVSLYKKTQLTAYNQDYTLVDINSYINNSLENYKDYRYYAIKNPISYIGTPNSYNVFQLSLKNYAFENTGYKWVFELYDGDKKIGTIEKNFIVK